MGYRSIRGAPRPWERRGFVILIVWQRSKDLAVLMYQITSTGPMSKDYSLRDQIRRSVISIPSNIAEGDERKILTKNPFVSSLLPKDPWPN